MATIRINIHFLASHQRLQRRLTVVFTICAFLTLMHRYWLEPIGGFLIVADPIAHANAIIPLAGDRARVTYAAELLHQGEADTFVITDMWIAGRSPTYYYAAMIQRQAAHERVDRKVVAVAPGVAKTTYEEALNIKQFAQANHWHALIVVTSTYHTRRARLILNDVFQGSAITIMVIPVATHWYQATTWYQSWEGWQTTATEYGKLALYFLDYHHFFT